LYLKRIEIQGFKSFADKTVLEFGQGVTSVVGPNGSGKSNISDAIRWVMGEMSAKTLRGSNMQDVIFAGTATRKPVNYAEVSLVLDNSDKLFPIDFDEVMVTRRVFRSGESVYQINKASCRLKDIHELFMDTGLGRDGYSMIGQGNVSQILSTKAEDRRSFFEEAAGVSKYKHRKDEALRKLASVTENLTRINDIVTELESRIKPLENQSRKARKYMELYEEYKSLDVSMSLIAIDKNKVSSRETEQQYENVREEIEGLRAQETEIEVRQNALYEKSRLKDEEQAAKNQALMENESKSMAAKNEISIAENDIQNSLAMAGRIEGEIEALEKKNKEAEVQIRDLEKQIAGQEQESKDLFIRFDEIQKENEAVFERLNECRQKIDAVKGDIIEKMNSISAKKANISGIETLRKSFIERRETVENELKAHGQGVETIQTELADNAREIQDKKEKMTAMRDRIEKRNVQLAALREEFTQNGREIGQMEVELNSKTSKKRILEGMENDYEGYAKSVKAVLKAQELKKLAIYGTVSGLIDVQKEYVTAIEISLGGALQNIVVETEEDAKSAIAYLRNARAGRATFLPVSSVSGRTLDNIREVSAEKGVIGLASDLIRYDKKYDGIVKSLLGRVVVVDNIDNAIALSRKFSYRFRTVTLEGDILNAGGSMSGGSVNKASGFLSRANEIKTLTADISALSKDLAQRKEEQAKRGGDIQNINNQLASYTPLLREYENDVLVLENTSAHLRQSLESSGESERALTEELAQIETQLAQSGDEIAAAINTVRRGEREIEELNAQVQTFEEEYETAAANKDAKAKELMDETLRLRTIEKDIEAAKNSIRDIQTSIMENQAQMQDKANDKRSMRDKIEALKQKIQDKNAEIDEIGKLSVEIKKQIEEIEQEKAGIMDGLKGIQNTNKDLTDKLILLQQELARLENRREKLQSDLENTINRLWDDYELTPGSAAEISIPIENEAESKKRTAELKGKIKALGSVNVDAIREYKETKERFDFLSTQKADMEKSQDNLNKVIDSMQELMEEHFQKQFEAINKSFGHVFKELFGGGSGRLYLSDPHDVMESGIEIEVQLPGKGLQNINLYSGGEKSFIAIALLFAILEVKPTPFCILDEIDAALDDVNVARFATYLKNYLSQTQFIVITHRRGTMEAANIMYGVTMQEKGVSKLLSLKIDDVEDEMLG